MPEILLATLNAKYAHCSFGLRYLLANLGELQTRAAIAEFEISQRTVDIAERLLAENPAILGFGVYIWNIEQTTRLVAELRRIRPGLIIVLGGPEVSYETIGQPIVVVADYVICGEADISFRELCTSLLAGIRPPQKIIPGRLPQFDELALPYDLYSAEDIAHRVIYVEASRGCPYECEFCLSALDIPVRQATLEPFLDSMQRLLDRGVRQFKFVDRTFNLNLRVSAAILEFFLERMSPGLFLHFEMVPDRLPDPLRELIARFPAGVLQFEVGIQTFTVEVSALISRRQDYSKLHNNLEFLRTQTGVHVHADLIVGLPGETTESFAAGFDQLVALRPQEIQVGMLKRLKGTPIIRHDAEWGMVYSPAAPFEILQTRTIPFAEMQRLRRFARYWDLVSNSGNFLETTPLLWTGISPFAGFAEFCDWLHAEAAQTHGIALKRLAELLFRFLVEVRGRLPGEVAETVFADYCRGGRSDRPPFLQPYISDERVPARTGERTGPRSATGTGAGASAVAGVRIAGEPCAGGTAGSTAGLVPSSVLSGGAGTQRQQRHSTAVELQ